MIICSRKRCARKSYKLLGYTCEKKPYIHGSIEVDSFTDFID